MWTRRILQGAENRNRKKAVGNYKKKLSELGDFLLFPLEHSLIQDNAARQAYVERAKEVFGVEFI